MRGQFVGGILNARRHYLQEKNRFKTFLAGFDFPHKKSFRVSEKPKQAN